MYGVKQFGRKYTKDYKLYITQDNKVISPFHDIPTYNGDCINVINEIQRYETGKFEINKIEFKNPIMQDIKNNKLRYVANIWPCRGYPWNYGAIPQTFEGDFDEQVQLDGDNDPLDVICIGEARKPGEVYEAKVLGCLALVDDGECDWKVLAIGKGDSLYHKLNDIEDVERYCGNLLAFTKKWFRVYKVPDGKTENRFAMDGEFLNRDFALKIVDAAHKCYKRMVNDCDWKYGPKVGEVIIDETGFDDSDNGMGDCFYAKD